MIILYVVTLSILLVILFIIVLVIYYSRYPRFDIDAVYTWVQYDRFLQEDMQTHGAEEEHSKLTANYVENKELLYSFRSLEKYAPWIRRIYLVVRDGQRPSWLLDDAQLPEKLRIINHSKILPPHALPTFNSVCIESFLHKIPGLAENYLYFNDDMILLNPVFPRDFFDRFQRPIETDCYPVKLPSSPPPLVMMEDKERRLLRSSIPDKPYEFLTMMRVNSGILSAVFPKRSRSGKTRYQSQHIPSANRVSYQEGLDAFLQTFSWSDVVEDGTTPTLYEHTLLSRTRKNRNIARNSLFKKYWNMYTHGSSTRVHDLLYIEVDHLKSKKKNIEEIATTQARFLCVQNSIAYVDKNAVIGVKDFETLHRILDARFPTPSSMEKKNIGKS